MKLINYQDGGFYNADCFDAMRLLPDGCVDLCIVDPPYRMTKFGKSCRPNYMPNGNGDFFGGVIPDTRMWMSELFRLLKEGSHIYVFCNTNDLQNFLSTATNCGFKFHNLISMIKNTNMPNRWYLKYTEIILFFRKGAAKAINDMTSRDYVNVDMRFDKVHPTQKPLTLIQKLIENSTLLGDVVLDPFAGSGTTAVAARNTGRRWICIERDETYFNAANARLA